MLLLKLQTLHTGITNQMTIKYTFDINTKQPVYAICDQDVCIMLTTSITTAIKKIQTK